jgi:hypothetical protein
MPSTFLPRREAQLVNWLVNFAAKVQADPAAYGVAPATASGLAAAVAAFEAAFVVATSPSTRTVSAVAAKNGARDAAVRLARTVAASIRASASVPSAAKIDLGLHVRTPAPPRLSSRSESLGAPTAAPALAPIGLAVGSVSLVASDPAAPTRRAKPAGVTGILLFTAVGDAPAQRPGDASLAGVFTRTRLTAEFSPEHRGKVATFFARYVGPRGTLGPWSAPASLPIAA